MMKVGIVNLRIMIVYFNPYLKLRQEMLDSTNQIKELQDQGLRGSLRRTTGILLK
jgi:hypothetical protein